MKKTLLVLLSILVLLGCGGKKEAEVEEKPATEVAKETTKEVVEEVKTDENKKVIAEKEVKEAVKKNDNFVLDYSSKEAAQKTAKLMETNLIKHRRERLKDAMEVIMAKELSEEEIALLKEDDVKLMEFNKIHFHGKGVSKVIEMGSMQ